MNRFRRDCGGATFVEFTAVFPVLLVLIMGSMDLTILAVKWVALGKATYAGARLATLLDPVATGINAKPTGEAGAACFNYSDGTTTSKCPTIAATVCTGGTTSGTCCPVGSSPAGCASNYPWNEATFAKVLTEMNKYMLTETLDRRQVQIKYEPTGLGFAQRPVGVPMSVTVQLRCVTYPFYILSPVMKWVFPAKASSCSGIPGTGMNMPSFATSLPSEDLSTND